MDGMTIRELGDWIKQHKQELIAALVEGNYQPQAVRGVEIPKPGGGVRQLGIPTVVDRLVQQAILQVLEPILDPTFSASSFGFRSGRGAHDALAQASRYVAEGRTIVVDMDLEKFFDRVNHDILMARLARRVADKRLLRIIRRFLRAGLRQQGVCVERHEGTPQGGPLSPLLANLLLDDLDKELEARGHCFCRYADDCNIYVRSQAAGERVLASLTAFLEGKLRLRVNRAKTRRGRCAGTQVSGPPPTRRRHADDRSPQPGSSQGPYSADHSSQPRRQPRVNDRRTQLVPDRLGHVLPPRESTWRPRRHGPVDSSQTALRSLEATETGRQYRRLPQNPRRALGSMLDDGRLRQRLVADGTHPRRPARHEQRLVPDPRPDRTAPQVFGVATVTETAGYDEYVRWCGRTGAVTPPPTRLSTDHR